jgi:hypothetical protein
VLAEPHGDGSGCPSFSLVFPSFSKIFCAVRRSISDRLSGRPRLHRRTLPALAAAIKAYQPSAALIASTVGESLLNLLRLPLIIMVDPAITNPQNRYEEEIKKDRKNCLLDRETGNCVN